MRSVKFDMITSSASPVGWEWRDGIYAAREQPITRFWERVTLTVREALRDE